MHLHDTTKPCTRCGEVKPLDEFEKQERGLFGRRSQCKACRNEINRLRYATIPEYREKKKTIKRDYYANHEEFRERYRRESANYQRENKDRVNENARKRWPTYHITEAARDNKRKKAYLRRAREKNGGSFTEKEWRALCVFYDCHCLCCGKQFPFEELTRDHIVPLSKQGRNTIDNIQALCMDCNRRKQDKTADYRTIVQLGMEWEV